MGQNGHFDKSAARQPHTEQAVMQCVSDSSILAVMNYFSHLYYSRSYVGSDLRA